VPDLHPLPSIDPYRDRTTYRRFLSELYHAEKAAMEGFALLSNPAYVQSSDIFIGASRKLVADERAHLVDIEAMIALLDDEGGGILPADPITEKFWSFWNSGEVFALPMRPAVAAMLILFSEGLGYSVLYNLAQATLDPKMKALLDSNVKDEQGHLRVSMTVLRRALKREPDFALDFAVHGLGFALSARHPARNQRPVFEGVGMDFNALFACGLRFVRDLFAIVLRDLGREAEAQRLEGVLGNFLCSPRGIRALYPLTFLPDPPLAKKLILGYGKLDQWLSARKKGTREQRVSG
jgi:hypothetical protein